MNQNNSREIKAIVEKMLAIGWDSKMKKHDGTSIVVSFTKAELCDLLLNLQETHHQELQKAREEERDKIVREIDSFKNPFDAETMMTFYAGFAQGKEKLIQAIQSKLDQPIS